MTKNIPAVYLEPADSSHKETHFSQKESDYGSLQLDLLHTLSGKS